VATAEGAMYVKDLVGDNDGHRLLMDGKYTPIGPVTAYSGPSSAILMKRLETDHGYTTLLPFDWEIRVSDSEWKAVRDLNDQDSLRLGMGDSKKNIKEDGEKHWLFGDTVPEKIAPQVHISEDSFMYSWETHEGARNAHVIHLGLQRLGILSTMRIDLTLLYSTVRIDKNWFMDMPRFTSVPYPLPETKHDPKEYLVDCKDFVSTTLSIPLTPGWYCFKSGMFEANGFCIRTPQGEE